MASAINGERGVLPKKPEAPAGVRFEQQGKDKPPGTVATAQGPAEDSRPDIDAAVEQMGPKAVPQRMEGDLLLDPRRLNRLVEQPGDLPRR